ncbi:oligosaccharide flippase family protein [Sphingomonas sp. CGMCC 1.13654]|uniref:Oligosaccharide flippase family protein n=1 Tax=Sphingomonas chungangi TaxID=2683589 RepID=A0A838L7L3_9SPHN|nr:oligosaccharide flippase family protein [Sphingomonas chungangi]MBA2934136.1 oligosaccharide flippase family protein [Sphingomonas chungangi]
MARFDDSAAKGAGGEAATAGLRRVGVNAGWLLGARGFQAVLSIAYLAMATRTLGLADFGRFTLIVAIGQGISAVVGFQTWQFVVRYGTRAQVEGDAPGVDRIIAFAALLDLAAALVGSLLALFAIWLLGPALKVPRDLYGAAFGFCFAILIAVRSTPIGVLRLDQRFRDAALADSVSPAVRAAGAALAAVLLPSVTGFLLAWAVAELATAAAYWWAALRKRGLALAPAGLRRLAREEPSLWRFVFLTNLSSTLTLTAKQFTLIVVGAFGGPAAAGMFRVAAQLAQAMVKATQTFSRAAYAELVLAITTGSDRALLARLTLIAGAVAVAMVGVAALFGEPLLRLIATRQFSGAYWPIVILVGAAGLDLLGFAFEPAMTARGQAGAAFRLRVVATGVQAGLLFLLLPPFGTIGGAWATFCGSLVAVLLTGWGVLRPAPPEPARRPQPL